VRTCKARANPLTRRRKRAGALSHRRRQGPTPTLTYMRRNAAFDPRAVRRARLSAGLTVFGVATRLGVTEGAVKSWEAVGAHPPRQHCFGWRTDLAWRSTTCSTRLCASAIWPRCGRRLAWIGVPRLGLSAIRRRRCAGSNAGRCCRRIR